MNGSTFGTLFRVSTFGESHGKALGVIIDGCPSGLELNIEEIQKDLSRRRPGQSKLVTPRKELDEFEILSGVFEGKTTGTPIAALVFNKDVKSKDYSNIKDLFRPGHADFTYFAKYGHRDYRGGGRSSARETVARVIAGGIAKQLLKSIGVNFYGGVVQVGKVKAKKRDWAEAEKNDAKCVDADVSQLMIEEIAKARKSRDSIGAVVEVVAEGVPPGWGEPIFAKLDAAIAGAMLSIPAVRGVEFGAGFSCAEACGSEFQDRMYKDGFASNNHGGVLGGISSGAPIVVRIPLKPTSSIPQDIDSIDTSFNETTVSTKGRHDPCVALRAAPIAEAMLALVLVDFWMQDLSRKGVRSNYQTLSEIKYSMRDEGK